MGKTEFSEFASALTSFFIDGMKPEEFSKALFKNIYIEGSHEEDPVDKILPRTYKSYYYGDTDISTLAKKICGTLDKVQFSDFLSLESDDSIENLCRVFRDDCSGINAENYGSKLADRFEIIITNASKPKRKKKSALSDDGASAPNGIDIKEKYGIALVAEVMSTCPNIGCTNSLFIRAGKQIVPNFEIVTIDPDEPIEENNLIAMCPSCSKKHLLRTDPAYITQITAIKKRFIELAEIQEVTANQNIEEDIATVLSKIPALPFRTDVDLNYEPVPLRNKIKADSPELLAQIKVWVNLHYTDVHETLQELNQQGRNRFEPFCLQVRLNFLNLRNKGLSQRQIYDGIVEWLQKATNGDRHACEVVTAYFVQKCEVFDVITE